MPIVQNLWGDQLNCRVSVVDPDLATKQALLEAVPSGQKRNIICIEAHDAKDPAGANLSFAAIDPVTFGFNAGATGTGSAMDLASITTPLKAVSQFIAAQTQGVAGEVLGVIFPEHTNVGSIKFSVWYVDTNA